MQSSSKTDNKESKNLLLKRYYTMRKLSRILMVLSILSLLFSCTNSDDSIKKTSTSNHIFKKEFISFDYNANPSNSLKIDITTVIDVELNAENLYPDGLYLVVTQNFRHKNSFGTFSPSTHVDTLFVFNNTNKTYILNDDINYINASYSIENPEVIIHDRSFSFYTP